MFNHISSLQISQIALNVLSIQVILARCSKQDKSKAGKVVNPVNPCVERNQLVVNLNFAKKMSERSEAKSVGRGFASKIIFILNILTRSFAARFSFAVLSHF